MNNSEVNGSSAAETKACGKSGAAVSITVDSCFGHFYKLQRVTSLSARTVWQDIGNSQNGATQGDGSPTTLTFADSGASAAKSFYRIAITFWQVHHAAGGAIC